MPPRLMVPRYDHARQLRCARAVAALLVLSFFLAGPAWSATVGELESLRGLKGVDIAVEQLRPEVEGLGLRRDQIKAAVEADLMAAHIKILTEKDIFTGKPWLYINIHAFAGLEGRLIIYAVSVELIQQVRLVRDPLISTTAVTWSISQAGNADRSQTDVILKVVKELVARFIQDYSLANRK